MNKDDIAKFIWKENTKISCKRKKKSVDYKMSSNIISLIPV